MIVFDSIIGSDFFRWCPKLAYTQEVDDGIIAYACGKGYTCRTFIQKPYADGFYDTCRRLSIRVEPMESIQ